MYTFSFEKSEVWKEPIQLSKDLYKVTSTFPDEQIWAY